MEPGEHLRKLEALSREIGHDVGKAVDGVMGAEPGTFGFALFLFSFKGPEFVWISNARREDMVRALREFIRRNPPDVTSEGRN